MPFDLKSVRAIKTVCPLDCADTCSLAVDVVDQKIVKVRGSKVNPFTNGKICSKVATGMVEWVHGGKRLTTPLKRVMVGVASTFEPISWDQAYAEIKQNFDRVIAEHGPQAIPPLKYAGPMGLLSVGSMDALF